MKLLQPPRSFAPEAAPKLQQILHEAAETVKQWPCWMKDQEPVAPEAAPNVFGSGMSGYVRAKPPEAAPVFLTGKETVTYEFEKSAPAAPSVTHAYLGGTFDLLHCGHVRFFKWAKENFDFVIVSVNRDEFCARYKAAPAQCLSERMEMVAACRYVDAVIINTGDEDSKPAIREASANAHC